MSRRKSNLGKTGTIIGLGIAGAGIIALLLYGKQIIAGAQQVGQTAGQITAAPIVGFGEGLASSFQTGLNELKTFFGQGSGNAPGSTTSGSTPGTAAGSNPPPIVTTSNDQLAAELAALQKKINDMNNPNQNPPANPSQPPPTPPPAPTATPTRPPSPSAPTSGFGGAPGTYGTPIPGIDLGAGSTLQSGNNAYQYLLNLAKQSGAAAHPDLQKPISPHGIVNVNPSPDIFSQIQNALKNGISALPGIGVIRPIAPGEIIPGLFA